MRIFLPKIDRLRLNAKREDCRKNYARALALWKAAANLGDPESLYQVGLHYEAGVGAIANIVEAVVWYRRAAALDFVAACAKLGKVYLAGISSSIGDSRRMIVELFPNGASIEPNAAEAFLWNSKAAIAGDSQSQSLLGLQFASGIGTKRDYNEAEVWFTTGANAGSPAAHFGLGRLYASEQTGKKELSRAEEQFRIASERGHLGAKVCLAVLLLRSERSETLPEVIRLLTDAAEQGALEAMWLLGSIHEDESISGMWLRRAAVKGHLRSRVKLAQNLIRRPVPDHVAAAELLQSAAEVGDRIAQYELAVLFENGWGVPKDKARAVDWFTKAAAQGLTAAHEQLGSVFADESSVVFDKDVASEWFSIGAELGSARAQFLLGILKEQDANRQSDVVETYIAAAKRGSCDSALRLGIYYAEGNLVEQSFEQAACWYQVAVELGSIEAKWNLAFLYIRGLGVEKDLQHGLSILERGAAEGEVTAARALQLLYSNGLYIEPNLDYAVHWRAKAAALGDNQAACEQIEELTSDTLSADGQRHLELLFVAAERGYAPAQVLLARVAYEGELVAKDFGFAKLWMNKAADQGVVFAQAWLGDVLASAGNGPEDLATAINWYWKAADGGHIGSALVLTDLAMKGDARVSPAKIFEVWNVAAKLGDSFAQRMAGDLIFHGFGCDPDPDKGIELLRLSADGGNAAAGEILARVSSAG